MYVIIACAVFTGMKNIIFGNRPATFLHFACNTYQRFHPRGNLDSFYIINRAGNRDPIVFHELICNGAVDINAKVTFI